MIRYVLVETDAMLSLMYGSRQALKRIASEPSIQKRESRDARHAHPSSLSLGVPPNRAALLLIADNLLSVNNYFRAQGALWKTRNVDPRLQRVRVAKRFSRLAFVMVAGRQFVPHECCRNPHEILDKFVPFPLEHHASHAEVREQLDAAAAQLPHAAQAREADALRITAAQFEKARTSPVPSLGSLLKEVLANRLRLTVQSTAED